MVYMIAGLVLFAGIHLLPSCQTTRSKLISRLGENGYKILFAIISLSGLVLLGYGFSHSDRIPVYTPTAWGHYVTAAIMLVSLTLFAAANMPTNIKRVTRHPMLWGLVLWAIAHLLANGDRSSLILFGGLGVYGLLGMLSANLRGATKQTEKIPMVKEVRIIIAGIVAYAILVFAHPWLFGVRVY